MSQSGFVAYYSVEQFQKIKYAKSSCSFALSTNPDLENDFEDEFEDSEDEEISDEDFD
jgi:hypothetical protein